MRPFSGNITAACSPQTDAFRAKSQYLCEPLTVRPLRQKLMLLFRVVRTGSLHALPELQAVRVA